MECTSYDTANGSIIGSDGNDSASDGKSNAGIKILNNEGICSNAKINSNLVPQLSEDGITEADLYTATRVLQALGRLHPKHHKMKERSRKKKRKISSAAVEETGAEANSNVDNQVDTHAHTEGEEGGAKSDGIQSDSQDHEGVTNYQKPNLRPIRKALASVFEIHQLICYGGKSEEQHYTEHKKERTLKRQKMSESVLQKKYVAETALRRGRVEKLEKLKQSCKDEETKIFHQFMIPDGHVHTNTSSIENSKAITQYVEQNEDKGTDTGTDKIQNSIRLPKLRSCYVCKVRFRDLHSFYDQLCPSCAKLNFSKRHQSTSLVGKVAVVTGSRVKIGFQVCLKLLRAGAVVIATTRFPNFAAAAYRGEDDFHVWKDRLHLYGLDLRDVVGLEAFTNFLKLKHCVRGLDILINNACQTVRRPTAYYKPMVDKEIALWKESDDIHRKLLAPCVQFEKARRRLYLDEQQEVNINENRNFNNHSNGNSAGTNSISNQHNLLKINNKNLNKHLNGDGEIDCSYQSTHDLSQVTALTIPSENPTKSLESSALASTQFENSGISHSTAMSQIAILNDDSAGASSSIMPSGVLDINDQQLDLRKTNSWLLKMKEVSTPELMECMLINAIAPFVLNSRLQPIMTSSDGKGTRPDRYIVNVSAMEGKFYRYKMPNHPHTNMAKAALNMLTRTSSEELALKHRIFMNSIDTGWINDENPLDVASKTAKTNLFQTPIDEIDAAARILDPIFVGVQIDENNERGEKLYGKFLKDYKETEW